MSIFVERDPNIVRQSRVVKANVPLSPFRSSATLLSNPLFGDFLLEIPVTCLVEPEPRYSKVQYRK